MGYWLRGIIVLVDLDLDLLASPGFLAGMPQQREPITAIPWKPDHNSENSVPYSLQIVFGFFNVPQLFLRQGLWDGTSGIDSFSEKTWKSNHLLM